MIYVRFSADQVLSVVLILVMLGSVVYAVGDQWVPNILRTADVRGFSGAGVGSCLLLATMGTWVRLLYFAGPVAASGAQLQWSGPAQVLARQKALSWGAAGSCLLVLGMIAALSADAMGWSGPAVGVATGAALAVALVATVLLQKRDAPGAVRVLSGLFLAAAAAIATALTWSVFAGVVVGSGIVLGSLARERGLLVGRSHTGVPRWQLIRGHGNRWAVNAGIILLDRNVVAVVHELNSRPTRSPLPGFAYRIPQPMDAVFVILTRLLSTVAVPIAGLFLAGLLTHHILGSAAGLSLMLVIVYRLTIATARCAESWLASPALKRTWGQGQPPVAVGFFGPVLIVSLVFTIVVAATISPSWPALISLLAVPWLVLWRRHSAAQEAEWITLIATPAGALPVQAVDKLIAGYDVLAAAIVLVWLTA